MGVSVVVHEDEVVVEFGGLDRILALKGRLVLPIADITDARVARQADLRADLGWRIGGGYLPGAFATGHFGTRGRPGSRQLWDCYRDDDVLVVETRLESPWRVVLQHPDRDRLAWLIAERIER
ncbi:MAG: hypothetical protein MUE36_07330 [Acidimicrobiales bacterium]|jgi:hypothetical protein|nr:hypothetical protein [Acidimicrobiales bacterium]